MIKYIEKKYIAQSIIWKYICKDEDIFVVIDCY